MKPYDFLALVPIVQGAGGTITNWRVSSGVVQLASDADSCWWPTPLL